ncbi:YKU80 (YMR106C) [Zygosaccharomyces parabailii]|uniref:ATP-dependent DNA helicase II subunit 2 n=1 Tax=Zygosaccharomyces bailii (strain CLIB 213 / ATCC 58445 / CBS 680 / BCRC 21525 / NBRC 1098 / NCYC 1416 / NRRL Y-2227) TaxID=1333698 RepID=A0A8J2T5K6_ZYGB2|nr:YKU80 (YMR106C) [Zygosaccharomyces parabailii]CDF88999.1 ZYBA0S03-06788g1_1 [Zygosaccharomyces bailii CLIB 213]CDH16083.1 related to ATP-dependent DNA helicase II subunit 2 [Zygosaccharomyces bailii ISA1307]
MAECTTFILDVSTHMVKQGSVSKAAAYLEYTLLDKLKRGRKTDWISCYLANCQVAKNSQDVPGVFQVQKFLAPVTSGGTISILKQLQSYCEDVGSQNEGAEATESSMVQCLLVASLDCREQFKTRKMVRQAVVFTDDLDGLDLSGDELNVLAEELNLTLILVDCTLVDNEYANTRWGQLAAAIPGSAVFSINDMLREISSLPPAVVRPVRVFVGELRLGADVAQLQLGRPEDGDRHSINIKVEGFPATKAVPPIHRKTVVKKEIQGRVVYEPVKSVVEYEVNDSNSDRPVQVSPQSIAKAYRYGSDYVVLPSSLEEQRSTETLPGIDIRGFMDMDALPRHWLHSETRFILADTRVGGIEDVVALSAMVDVMLQGNKVAIVRFVAKSGAEVQMGVLCPLLVGTIRAFTWCRLPFAEEQRVSDFPRLLHRTTTSGRKIKEEAPSDIDSLMSQYIDLFDMDDEPCTPDPLYYSVVEAKETTLPLPQKATAVDEDPLRVPAIHLHRTQQVLLEWIHQCLINKMEFHVPEMPDVLVAKISPRYKPNKKGDELLTRLKKDLNIKKTSRGVSTEDEDEEEEQEVPNLQSLLSRAD